MTILVSQEGSQSRTKKKRDGIDGQVLPLTRRGDGFHDVFYTLDIILGDSGATYPVLLDTGSSDLWVASKDCSACRDSPALYSPSESDTSIPTTQSFSNNYLSGSVSGSIYWEQVTLGSYTILHQALAAATTVENEALGLGFAGIIGFGPPSLSAIQRILPAGSGGGDQDGAAIVSNLFGLGDGIAPQSRNFSVTLDRPGFEDVERSKNAWPSRLGIGKHVEEIEHAFSGIDNNLHWLQLAQTSRGYTHWMTNLDAVTVWKDGTPNPVNIGLGGMAVLDTGGGNWLATKTICDAIYGSWGVSISQDGNYYVPCNDVLNMTITLGSSALSGATTDSVEIPIHPLDMSTFINNDRQANPTSCLGTLQLSQALGTTTFPAQMALGISFLRNVYTVYSVGSSSYFSDDLPSNAFGENDGGVPQMAVLPITNITLAMAEFHNVRILNLTPDGDKNQPQLDGNSSATMGTLGKIMLGIGSFIALCILLFVLRWVILSRRFKKQHGFSPSILGHGDGGGTEIGHQVKEFAEMIRRKTTLRLSRRRRKKGGMKRIAEPSEEAVPENIAGEVATRSAIGHAAEEMGGHAVSEMGHGVNEMGHSRTDSGGAHRQGSGPFAGFSLMTFIGARRIFGKHGYEPTHNPGASNSRYEMNDLGTSSDGLPTEDELRRRRFEEYQRKKKEEIEWKRRQNDTSVWSDVTWVDKGDGTLTPVGTVYGANLLPGGLLTPNETVVGSSAHLNQYGYPKDVDDFGAYKHQGGRDSSDGASTERGGSTLHGSQDLSPKGIGSMGQRGRMSGALVEEGGRRSRSASRDREFAPLLNPSSTSVPLWVQPSQASGPDGTSRPVHMTHKSIASLELNRPRREDSTQGFTSSPMPIPDSAGGNSSSRGNTPPLQTSNLEQNPGQGSGSFNPFNIPVTVHAPSNSSPHLVMPHRDRPALAVEPSLSPLTEVNSSEFVSTPGGTIANRLSVVPSNRTSLMGAVLGSHPNFNPDLQRIEAERNSLERQSSIGSSMESEVLVPLPISLMKLPRSWSPPKVPMKLPDDEDDRPLPVSNPPIIAPVFRPIEHSNTAPLNTRIASVATSSPLARPPINNPIPPLGTTVQPRDPSSTPRAQTSSQAENHNRNPYDMLGFDGFGLRDSRFPSFAQPHSIASGSQARPPNVRSASASASRPASVAVPDVTVRPRPRMTDPTLPRPQSEAYLQGGAGSSNLPPSRPVLPEKSRSQPNEMPKVQPIAQPTQYQPAQHQPPSVQYQPVQHQAPSVQYQPVQHQQSLQTVQTPEETVGSLVGNSITETPEREDMRDFLPSRPHNAPREQHSLPAIGSSRLPPAHTRTSEPATSSMGPRSRGPRPMGSSSSINTTPVSPGPRPRASSSTSTQGRTSQSSQGTTSDSPATRPQMSTSSSNSSLPPGAMAPTLPESRPRADSSVRRLPVPDNLTSPPAVLSLPATLETHSSGTSTPGYLSGIQTRSNTYSSNALSHGNGTGHEGTIASSWNTEIAGRDDAVYPPFTGDPVNMPKRRE
ncbi:hypothetical protein CPB86DRAFT_876073 [Serendipita vermifera]|nr:hypothetical protein CPB86DRAFT_876073 [Serendipita vermifera]